MARRHLKGVSSDQFDRRTVCHLDVKMSGDDVANVMDLDSSHFVRLIKIASGELHDAIVRTDAASAGGRNDAVVVREQMI